MKRVLLLIALSVSALAQNNLHDFAPVSGAPGTFSLNVVGGVAIIGTTPTVIPNTNLTLTANSTSYVYVDLIAGIITSNTTGFNSTSYPIAVVTTDGRQVTTIKDVRSGGSVVSGVSSSRMNNVILLDGTTYPTLQSLLTAALTQCTGAVNCILDARNPTIGTQTLTNTTLPNVPTTLLTGPYTIQYDSTATVGLQPNSDFTLKADNTLIRPSAADVYSACSANTQIGGEISPVVTTTTASTTSGSKTITVASANRIQVGTMVAVLAQPYNGSGAAGIQVGTQSTTVNQGPGMLAGDTSVTVAGASSVNFGPAGGTLLTNYLLVDSEIMSYGGMTATTFTGLSRGLLGTTAATHANGATIYQVGLWASEVQAVSGTTLTMTETAPFTVVAAPAQVGSTHILLDGSLTLDGNLDAAGHVVPAVGCTSQVGVGLWLASKVTITENVRIQNNALAGVHVFMSRKNYLSGQFSDMGLIIPEPASNASGTGTTVTLTQVLNPIIAGFVNGGTVVVSGGTGASACYNGTFTLTNVTSTQLQYAGSCTGAFVSGLGAYQTSPPTYSAGADINMFNSRYNRISTVSNDGGYFEILMDDRSVISEPYMGPSSYNRVDLAPDTGGTYRWGCLEIEGGSSFNTAVLPYCTAANAAISMTTSGQWTTDPNMVGNVVHAGSIDSQNIAINFTDVSGATKGNMVYAADVSTGSIVTPGSGLDAACYLNATVPYLQCQGAIGGSSYSWSMLRSGGNAGFPDIKGNGSAALVLGDSFGVAFGSAVTAVVPGAVNTTDLGTTALPYKNLWLGTAATNNYKFQPTATTGARIWSIPDWGANGASTQNQPFIIVLTSQYTNSTTGFTNVAGGNTIQFAVAANQNYTMTCHLYYQAAATAGLNIEFTGPASPTAVAYGLDDPSAPTAFNSAVATAFGTSLGQAVGTAATNYDATVSFSLINGANTGTVNLLAKSSAAAQLQIQTGSFCQVQ